jgi:drug/metabolite transporter (DMT)-like permease
LGKFPITAGSVDEPWFPYSILLGILFIVGFNILAQTVQKIGVTLASVGQKMSLIMTVSFTLWYFSETVNTMKILGFLAAFASIILVNLPSKKSSEVNNNIQSYWYLFILTLLFSGLIEILLFYVEAKDYSNNADIGFIVSLFGMAAIIGSIIMITGLITQRLSFSFKNVLAGICLGIPNFFTIYLLLVLINKGYEGSQIFPILNVSIILGAAAVGLIGFKEKLHRIQWVGFLLGVVCIVLIVQS